MACTAMFNSKTVGAIVRDLREIKDPRTYIKSFNIWLGLNYALYSYVQV